MKENEAKILKDKIDYIMPFVKNKHAKEELKDMIFQINCLVKEVKVEEGTENGFDWYCQCGNYLSAKKDKTINFCPKCGEKLDWD